MKKYIIPFLALFVFAETIHAQIDRSKQPIPGSAPAIHLETPQTFELENGLKVLVVKNTKLPRVRIQLQIDNPPIALGDYVGANAILASMLGNGTATISKEEFNEEIDFLGASIFFGSQSAYASSLSKYFDRVFELFADAVINPLLTEEEFQKEKDRYLEALKNNKKDVSTTSRQVAGALLYGHKHPKGEFATEENVANITYVHVREYFNTFFSPENAYLVVIGDVDKAKVEALAKIHFDNWLNKTVPNVTYSDPQDVPYTQINFIDMPNAVQSEIIVENVVNLKMSDPDYFPVLIANRILGGDFNSLLNMNLREDKGYTYGARSSTGSGKYVTGFTASSSVRNAVTDSAVVEFLKEIRNIREVLVTNDQLVLAKAKYTGDFVLALERPETVANYALNIETQNLPKNFYKDYLKKINAVTAADVQRVAKKYYLADNLRIVVTGKGSEVLEGLKNIKNNEGKNIPVFYFDNYGNPVEEPNYNIALDPSVTVESVLEKYINAIGGKTVLENVSTLYTKAVAEMQGMQIQLEEKVTASNKSLQLVSLPAMGGMVVQKAVFNGEGGYQEAQGQKKENSEEENASQKASAYPFVELTAKNSLLKGIENVNGSNAYAVNLGNYKVAFYDVATGLKVKEENTISGVNTVVYYSDYKVINGINFPHVINVSAGPQEMSFTVSEIKINEGVSDQDFQ